MTEAQQDDKLNQHSQQILNIQAVNVAQQTKIDATLADCRALVIALRGIHPQLPYFDFLA